MPHPDTGRGRNLPFCLFRDRDGLPTFGLPCWSSRGWPSRWLVAMTGIKVSYTSPESRRKSKEFKSSLAVYRITGHEARVFAGPGGGLAGGDA
jgi:hypothetical protein